MGKQKYIPMLINQRKKLRDQQATNKELTRKRNIATHEREKANRKSFTYSGTSTGPQSRAQALNWYGKEKKVITFEQFLAKAEKIIQLV